MTYHYRIYTFQNGLGETVFRAKPIHRFWPQCMTSWLEERTFSIKAGYNTYDKWANRDRVMAAINDHATDRARERRADQADTLKLIVTEDVPVKIV